MPSALEGTGVAGTKTGSGSGEGVAGADSAGEGAPEAVGPGVGSSESEPRDGHLLGVVPTPFEGAPDWLQALLLVALAAAIILLLLAALPAERVRVAGASALVLHRRTELAVAGAAILAAVAILALVL